VQLKTTLSKKRPCRIIINNEVNSVVEGIDPSDSDKLYNQYGIFAAGYFFHPKVKLGIWDGKLRFFSKTGVTLTYLLEELIGKLLKMGYIPTIDDRRKGPYVKVDYVTEDEFPMVIDKFGKPMKLRYYQVEATNALIDAGTAMIEASTNSGKSWINAALVNAYGKKNLRTITIVPSTSLVIQTMKDFKSAGLDVGEYTGSTKDLDHLHVISTWQAIKNHPQIIAQFQVVVVDEVHTAKSKILNDLVNVHGCNIPYRFGLTGTLPKEQADRMTIHAAFGNVVYKVPASKMIEEGYSATLGINIQQLYENHPAGYFPDFTAEKSYLQIRKERLEWISNSIYQKSQQAKGNSLVLVSSVNVGKKLQKLIPNSIFLCGADSAEDRKKVYDLFETNDNLTVIATVQIAGTGLSIDRIFNLFFIDVGKSFTRVIQAIGRGLRMGKDKSHINVYDICSTLKYSKKHLLLRIQYYNEAKYPFTNNVIKYRNYDDIFDQTQDNIMAQIESDISLDY
jgi:superfamily II DNA or RNA helicase